MQKPPRHGHGGFLTGQQVRLNETLTLGALPSKFASAAHSFCFLTSLLFRRLFKISAGFHFTEQAFTLHLFLKRAQGLFDIIVANSNLNNGQLSIKVGAGRSCRCAVVAYRAEIKPRL